MTPLLPPSSTQGLRPSVGDRSPEPLQRTEAVAPEPCGAERRFRAEEEHRGEYIGGRSKLQSQAVSGGERVEYGNLKHVVGERHAPAAPNARRRRVQAGR